MNRVLYSFPLKFNHQNIKFLNFVSVLAFLEYCESRVFYFEMVSAHNNSDRIFRIQGLHHTLLS